MGTKDVEDEVKSRPGSPNRLIFLSVHGWAACAENPGCPGGWKALVQTVQMPSHPDGRLGRCAIQQILVEHLGTGLHST